jgi:acyl-CoA synthetase (NDP forming)
VSRNLDVLFKPSSVALIGASTDAKKWGNWMARHLIESNYQGDVYLVATKGGIVCGRETYRTIFDIPKPIDVAIIGIPSQFVSGAVEECVKKGVKAIIIVTAGFGETGEEGRKVEKDILELARSGGTRIVGPNCMGIYNSSISLNTSAFDLSPGFIGFLTQSGNFAMDVNYNVRQRKLGYSKWASFGNQIDILWHEYLTYIKDDPDTRVILLYIEGLRRESVNEGREFLRVAKETTKERPIVAIKIGTSSAGARSAASHTGSLAGSNEIYDAAFKQAGIIRVTHSNELLDVGEALAKCPLPRGNKIAILTDGGGHGTIACDAAEKNSLIVPILSEETKAKLKEILPPQASIKNPVDFAGGAEADLWNFVRCSEILLQDKDIDGLVIVGQWGGYGIDLASEFYELEEKVSIRLTELVKEFNKPIINHTMYQPSKAKSLQLLSEGGIPVYPVVETAMKCMGALTEYSRYLEKCEAVKKEKRIDLPTDRARKVRRIINECRNEGRTHLVEPEAREILEAYGVPMSVFKMAKSKDEVGEIAESIGFPAVMKIVSPEIIHKSDAGCVKLNLRDKKEAGNAFEEIVKNAKSFNPRAKIHGVMITGMERKGIETIVGVVTDQTFGPTVMIGLGGIFVEVLKDISFGIAPITIRDAYEMIERLKGVTILGGIRGQKPADMDALVDLLMRVADLATENTDIKEMDLNPVFALEKGISIADARVILTEGHDKS